MLDALIGCCFHLTKRHLPWFYCR